MSEQMSVKPAFSNRVLIWGEKQGRLGLPWQPADNSDFDIYKVWISEIMLQQTQLSTVLKRFDPFINLFPDVFSLASSKQESVVLAWSGLGFYRRAINLHEASKILCAQKNFKFPKKAADWVKLPGIGYSTAAAISAFTSSERIPILDINVVRVLSRHSLIVNPMSDVRSRAKLFRYAQIIMPHDPNLIPRYSQFIMDIGALICRKEKPLCSKCPVSSDCDAFQQQKVAKVKFRKSKVWKKIKFIWAIEFSGDMIILEYQRTGTLWGGLWTPKRYQEEIDLPKGASFLCSKEFPISNSILLLDIWLVKEISSFDSVKTKSFNLKSLDSIPVPNLLKEVLKEFKLLH